MSQFQFVDFPVGCHVDDLLKVVEIMAVQYHVERNGEIAFVGKLDGRLFLLKRGGAGEPVIRLGVDLQLTDLQRVEAGGF